MSKVLITGCSSGFGFLTAQTLAAKGHDVVATMRVPEGRNADNAARLQATGEGAPGQIHVLELDVTNDASVDGAVARALELTGELDVVVNNAGFGTGGLMETITVEQMRDLFEVNVFGAHRVNRAVLPHLRSRKQGLVIHISSIIGRILFPYFGAYAPSKFAIEAMAEGYHHELKPIGVDVTIVQPGAYLTDFFNNMQQAADKERVASYGEHAEVAASFWAGAADAMGSESAPRPQLVADGILELVEMPAGQRPLRMVIDPLLGAAVTTINQTISGIQTQILQAITPP